MLKENDSPDLFPKEIMEEMEIKKSVPKLTKEAVFFYNSEGIDVNKCGTCPQWINLRTLFHLTDGLMTSCVPCIKNVQQKN